MDSLKETLSWLAIILSTTVMVISLGRTTSAFTLPPPQAYPTTTDTFKTSENLSNEMSFLMKKPITSCARRSDLLAGRTFEPIASISWHYFKAESIPPFTSSFFYGPLGAQLENVCSGILRNFINSMEQKVKDIEEQERQAIAAKEAEIIAAHERAIEEARQKEELRKKALEEKAAAEAAKKKSKKEEPPKGKDDKGKQNK
ncbi:hypothetical protein EVAR_58750_1 [Eumeta japonica]|uniref:Uncharacterized protein n=1 Tax=Eumeta variegata TaxID=151549 RepID=A0A4C1ZGH2_EUMVA|nr:hypothetical protein EVAR_58750_1 [Eumeta japonica]